MHRCFLLRRLGVKKSVLTDILPSILKWSEEASFSRSGWIISKKRPTCDTRTPLPWPWKHESKSARNGRRNKGHFGQVHAVPRWALWALPWRVIQRIKGGALGAWLDHAHHIRSFGAFPWFSKSRLCTMLSLHHARDAVEMWRRWCLRG